MYKLITVMEDMNHDQLTSIIIIIMKIIHHIASI